MRLLPIALVVLLLGCARTSSPEEAHVKEAAPAAAHDGGEPVGESKAARGGVVAGRAWGTLRIPVAWRAASVRVWLSDSASQQDSRIPIGPPTREGEGSEAVDVYAWDAAWQLPGSHHVRVVGGDPESSHLGLLHFFPLEVREGATDATDLVVPAPCLLTVVLEAPDGAESDFLEASVEFGHGRLEREAPVFVSRSLRYDRDAGGFVGRVGRGAGSVLVRRRSEWAEHAVEVVGETTTVRLPLYARAVAFFRFWSEGRMIDPGAALGSPPNIRVHAEVEPDDGFLYGMGLDATQLTLQLPQSARGTIDFLPVGWRAVHGVAFEASHDSPPVVHVELVRE